MYGEYGVYGTLVLGVFSDNLSSRRSRTVVRRSGDLSGSAYPRRGSSCVLELADLERTGAFSAVGV